MPTAGSPASARRAPADRIWTADFVKVTAATTLVRTCTQVQIVTMPLFFYHLGSSHALADGIEDVSGLGALSVSRTSQVVELCLLVGQYEALATTITALRIPRDY